MGLLGRPFLFPPRAQQWPKRYARMIAGQEMPKGLSKYVTEEIFKFPRVGTKVPDASNLALRRDGCSPRRSILSGSTPGLLPATSTVSRRISVCGKKVSGANRPMPFRIRWNFKNRPHTSAQCDIICNGFSTITSIYFEFPGDFSDPIDPDKFDVPRDAIGEPTLRILPLPTVLGGRFLIAVLNRRIQM